MTGNEFVELAGKLLVSSQNPPPALCRTIVSRAYYGAFHLARGCLQELGFRVTRDHGLPTRLFMAAGHPDALEVGKRLSDLQTHRIKADYDLDDRICQRVDVAREQVEVAAELKSFLARCRQEPARSQIKANIEAYHRRASGG